MRRAAIQAFRTARRGNVRRALTAPFSSSANYAVRYRFPPDVHAKGQPLPVLQSSIYSRNFIVALISSLVASGAWFAYKSPFTSEKSPAPFGTQSQGSSIFGSINGSPFLSPNPQIALTPLTSEEAAASRRALVVENDQFFTGDLVGEEPLSKNIDGSDRLVLEMLTPEQATQKLRQNEESFNVGRGRGVVRYDVVQLASNNPIEDDHAEKIIQVPENAGPGASACDWMFWGVFDGHSGWITSAKLRQTLISYVARELNGVYKSESTATELIVPSPQAIDEAIKKGFVRLDNEICWESVNKVTKEKSKRVAAELLAPALSGACALLSFYDSKTKLLRVACTGDSRAVLGRRGASGKWTATPLSEDQTGGTPSENARLRKEHPGEDYVTRNGRILGQLEPSRAFGDAIYKWDRETAMRMKANFFGKTPSPLLKTPPYVTAEPIITTTKIEPEKGDFLVMATDGLWECLTNEEVVGLVGRWLDSHGEKSGTGMFSWFSTAANALPVENHTSANAEKKNGQRAPIRQDQWPIHDGDERFVVEDKNAATHLIRNALGGKDRDMVSALLTLPSPYSRRYRDDLTVEVIFFGEGTPSGDVARNPDASAKASSGLRPKL